MCNQSILILGSLFSVGHDNSLNNSRHCLPLRGHPKKGSDTVLPIAYKDFRISSIRQIRFSVSRFDLVRGSSVTKYFHYSAEILRMN